MCYRIVPYSIRTRHELFEENFLRLTILRLRTDEVAGSLVEHLHLQAVSQSMRWTVSQSVSQSVNEIDSQSVSQ